MELVDSTPAPLAPRIIATQHNQLISACYELSLLEKRLLLLCISQIDSRAVRDKSDALEFEITVADWKKMYGATFNSIYYDVAVSAKRLHDRKVTIKEKNNEKVVFNWIDTCRYMPGEGKIKITFGLTISPYLTGLSKNFTPINLLSIRTLNSIYSIRIYELLMQKKDFITRTITIEELRETLMLSDSYSLIGNIKNRIIKPAVDEINEKTDLDVTWTAIKEGRKVVAIKFVFFPKE